MADGENEQPHSTFGITVGKVIAGAAIALGAVVLVAAILPNLGGTPTPPATTEPGVLSKIGTAIANLFMEPLRGPIRPGIDSPYTGAFSTTGKVLIGAGLVGGGYALASAMRSKEAENQDIREASAVQGSPPSGGYAAAEQERAIAGLMKARLMATNPEYFAQMAAQGRA